MSTVTGKNAEDKAAEHLRRLGYKVLEQNWKTRYCEIDIVAEKAGEVWFVEVKYRSSARQGFGYEYVTPKKLQQMHFAAEMWVSNKNWRGAYQLAVISIDAEEITFLEDL